jgi:hypothetical protein
MCPHGSCSRQAFYILYFFACPHPFVPLREPPYSVLWVSPFRGSGGSEGKKILNIDPEMMNIELPLFGGGCTAVGLLHAGCACVLSAAGFSLQGVRG